MLDTDNYQIFLIFATETETESQPPKLKPIQNVFATETENRNRKSATETETDSKYFCHRNRKLKPIDNNQFIIFQYENLKRQKKMESFSYCIFWLFLKMQFARGYAHFKRYMFFTNTLQRHL